MPKTRSAILMAACTMVCGCGRSAGLPVSAGMGPSPTLPKPSPSLIPTIKVARAVGWTAAQAPRPAEGLSVNALATGLDHPRWLYVLPNGDVLVAETNAPARPLDGGGIRGWFFRKYQAKGGGAVPSANRITLLRDADGDGVAEMKVPFLERLHSPFGMALVGEVLFIANTDAVVRFPYRTGDTAIAVPPVKVADLPGGLINHHWTKSLIASADGRRLYVGVGSNSNAAERGMEAEDERASILEIDVTTGMHRVYASGLRNPVGMAWEPETRMLWVAVNERDELGSDLVPDYMTSVRDGAFYGWPWSYYGRVDHYVQPQRPDQVARALVPDYALGPHTASLGLAWSGGSALGHGFATGMFVGQHGSWNRNPPSGYRVIFVPFRGGVPAGDPIEVLTGFLEPNGTAHGRPVGVAVDRRGALLVADDVGNVIWRVTGSPP